MRVGLDFPLEFQLRPPELPHRLDIQNFLLEGQLRLQDNHILRPADGHGLSQHLWGIFVCVVELPHPPQVPRGETGGVRVRAVQILCRGDSRAFLRPAAHQLADFTVQFHLRQSCRYQCVHCGKHGTVVYRLSDVHSGSSFPARARLIFTANGQALGPMTDQGLDP